MKTALVTGDDGFVGRHMRNALSDRGYWVQGCDIVYGEDCRQLFASGTRVFDLVVHCAAVVGGRLTISGDPLALAVDLAIDSDMFRWAQRTRQRRVVYFSSSAAYPTHLQTTPGASLRESDINLSRRILGVPDLTYGWAKLTGEMLAAHTDIPVHIFRPFSGYGEGQTDDYPFPAYINRAVDRDDPFVVWGDGEQARDFVHIDDVVGAVFAAVDQDFRLPLNIGTGRPTTFKQLAAMVTEEVGYLPEVTTDMSKPTGPAWRVADTERLRSVYEPRVSLEEGVRRSLANRGLL